MVRVGLLLGSLVLTVTGGFFLSLVGHWFPGFLLLAGLCGLALAFVPEREAAPSEAPPQGLRVQLEEVEGLRRDGLLREEEAAAKRAELLAAWGRPPQS